MKTKNTMRNVLGLVTGLALLATGLAFAPPAGAVENVTVQRLAGQNRYETAAAVAKAAYPSGAQRVIVANGRDYPDALAGAGLAGAVDAPMLLTERDSLPAATSTAINDLRATTIYVLGGTRAVSTGVEAALATGGRRVIRIAGDDRYETAAAIAETIGLSGVAPLGGRRTAIIATGLGFADALAGGPIAGAGNGTGVHPILLVSSTVPDATFEAIDQLDIAQVVILGGTAAVSSDVETRLEAATGAPAIRLAGRDRFATAVAVARAAEERFGFTTEEVLLADGFDFADALAGGPLGAVRQAPVVLTPTNSLATATRAYLESESQTIERLLVLGGTLAVSDAVAKEAETAAEAVPQPPNEAIAVSPRTANEQDNGTTREYIATGLGTTPVDIVLVPCASVTQTSTGETRLANTNTNTIADGTAQSGAAPDLAAVANARISSVNGTARQAGDPTIPNDDYANAVTPVDGTVTFTVQGPAASSTETVCAAPVVFVDANADNALNGATANPTAPSEDFGTGGGVTFSSVSAPAGQFGAHRVSSTDKAANRFNGCAAGATPLSPEVCRTFRYDANDVFQVASQPVTLAQFEARLSPGDQVQGTYDPEASGVSTFNLTDSAPLPPTGVTATATGTTVRVSFTDSATPTVDRYRLYRAPRGTACPDFNTTAGRTSYTAVPAQPSTIEGQPDQGETADTGNASPPLTPAPTYTIVDRTATANTPYCYVVVSVDGETASDPAADESAGSAPAAVTTTTPQAVVTDSRATSGDATLGTGDTIVLTFDRVVVIDDDGPAGGNTTLTVRGANQIGAADETFRCGETTRATCALDATGRILTVTIATGVTTTQQYPLTLQSVTNLFVPDSGDEGTDPDPIVVDLTNSDRRIQQA